MDIAIKHIKELLEFFKEFRVSENLKIAGSVQISTGLEIQITCKNHPVQQKKLHCSFT